MGNEAISGEKNPSKQTVLGSLSRSDRTSLQVRRSEVQGLRVTLFNLFFFQKKWSAKWTKKTDTPLSFEHGNLTDFTCVACKEVRLICPEGLNRCFEDSVSPRIASEFNF